MLNKVLVTGASGLLGSKLMSFLSKENEVTPTHSLNLFDSSSIRMNITEREVVLRTLDTVRSKVVIHAAAMTNVDNCETNRELAWRINALGAKNVAEGCARIGARLVHISTDYVFDGQKGSYVEADKTHPINYYGLTKLKGEEFAMKLCPDSIIIRTSVLYGWHPTKPNFATWVVDSLRKRKPIDVATDQYCSPTLADDLARIICGTVAGNRYGIYHASGAERVSRYDFALRIAEVFRLDTSLIRPAKMADLKAWVARRPVDSSLCVQKLQKDFRIEPLDMTEALQKMMETEK